MFFDTPASGFAPLPRLADDAGAIGRPKVRRSGREKVTGTAAYTAERDGRHSPDSFPGLLHAVAVPATIAKGRVTGIDASAAEAMPGVRHVLTPANSPKLKVPEGPPGLGFQSIEPAGPAGVESQEIVHGGQYVAAVIADTFEAARDGALAVKVTYEEEPNPVIAIEAVNGSEERPNSLMGDPPVMEEGDAETAVKEAALSVDLQFKTDTNHHNPIEPHATIAAFGKDANGSETLSVRETTQNLYGTRGSLAEAFGLKPEQVEVVCDFVGGAFGSKGVMWPQALLACKCAKLAGAPVKLVVTRRQMYGGTGHRSPTLHRVALGAKEDGTLTGIVHEGFTTSSIRDDYTDAVVLATKILYAAPARRLSQRMGRLNTQLPTFMRAPAETPGMYPLECAMDELAAAAGMDPIELRLRNEPPKDPMTGKPFSGRHFVQCLKAGADRFGWADRPLQPRKRKKGRWLIGTGVAAATYPAFGFPTEVELTLRANGTVRAVCATHELGTGTATVQAQVAADLLGVSAGRVDFDLGSTAYPKGGVSGGSATTLSVGSALRDAAEKLKAALLKHAPQDSPLSGAKPGDVTFDSGKLVLTESGKGASLEDLLEAAAKAELSAKGSYAPGKSEFSKHSFGATFVEVGVDEEFGLVRVRRMLGCYACGTILNRKLGRSQFLGGMVMGIGSGLLEVTHHDTRLARWTNDNLAEYHVPVNADVPDLDVMWIDDPDFNASPIGAKGIGEIGITGVNAALANAVWHATGKRHRTIPITPEAVMA
ncbi:xanthine dehydrogenase family protein molybdopterin-binding subunit [Alienimonas chondri]|uniref:Xanthine dehydrogenase YagR molybdenum-binding subunit n=1 Tax=Alienimonas chondri TaxID=2681879 RepID=A0ABX1VA24_9PLAN|nr:xanthine dehydrogenase family protein molybdopterin-binding subunit [Alienimonas chondri]NNJ24233.1 putative xanthine dehydrogenase YagR molybdenum-binding subunit [Alienimonas chondri]